MRCRELQALLGSRRLLQKNLRDVECPVRIQARRDGRDAHTSDDLTRAVPNGNADGRDAA